MTTRSRAQVDKDIARRQAGIKVPVSGQVAARKITPGRTPSIRSTGQVDKDIHIRSLGGKVAARGRLSDAATGRLGASTARSGGALGGLKGTAGRKYDRDRIGRFS